MRRIALAFALCCSVTGYSCAPKTLVPVTDSRFTAFESDETRLWNRSAEQEKRINESGFLYKDAALEEYLNATARKLQPERVYEHIPFRIRVLKSPYLNAFALPNGAVYVHTGILASMENEAQLATILGHEMTHATNRHGVMEFRDAKNKSAVLASLTAATGGIAAVFGPVALASVLGYSRDLEREADREGFALIVRAGYDPAEAVTVFEHIKREIEQEKTKEPFFFGTHPRIVERIENFRELIKGQAGQEHGSVKNSEIFQARVKQLLLDNARLNIQIGRYGTAESAVQKYVERYPQDAEAYYLLGEANRQRGDGEHDKKAEEHYRKALSIDAGHFDSHKMLGMMLYKTGDMLSAKQHLEKYLILNVKAPDRAYIEEYIRRCDQRMHQE